MLPNLLIKNLKTHIFPTTQQSWLQAVTSNKFTFNSDALKKYTVPHYTFPKINNFCTSDYSNYIIYMTSTSVHEAKILSRAHSFKHNTVERINNDTYLCLIEESNISYITSYNMPMALLPFIIGFISEGDLINTSNYIEYPPTFVYPIRDYLLVDYLPTYNMYVNFHNSFDNDLSNLEYSPEYIKLIHYEVGRILSAVSYEHKGNIYDIETSTKLFTHIWEQDNRLKYIK